MRVVKLEVFHVRIPLKRRVTHASHTRKETDNLVVRCELSDGTIGFGEGVPREYVTGEDITSSLELLRQADLERQLDREITDFVSGVRLAEQLQLRPRTEDDRGILGNAARCAVELAILDACGRAFGEPLGRVTEVISPQLYQFQPFVRYSGILANPHGWKRRLYPLVYRLTGFTHVKAKVGIPGQDDVNRLRILRRWLGRQIDLRVDANEGWSAGEVIQRIRELEPFGISCVEQPVPHEEISCLAEVRSQVHTPIMLDESLCSLNDAERAIRHQWCDLFNIRLSKCGGFIPSLRLAELARHYGLGYQLGCQVGETAILSAAGRHFATSVSGLRYLEGSYDRHLVEEPLSREDLTIGWGGRAPALTGCGLGITIDPQRLAAVTLEHHTILG
ncbi:MAG: dipeptide epimerase [Thermogemmata sp.]|nr:dipeptide epimerase [Thermogemmata sp.]